MKNFAKNIHATSVTSVQDYYGENHAVTAGLVLSGLPRGIGFGVNARGELVVKGDSFGVQAEWNRISTLAQNYIKAYKVAQNARITHPTAKMNMKVMKKQVILEVNL